MQKEIDSLKFTNRLVLRRLELNSLDASIRRGQNLDPLRELLSGAPEAGRKKYKWTRKNGVRHRK